MEKLRNNNIEILYKTQEDINTQYAIKKTKLEEGEKISIVSDSLFKTMFLNSKRLKYSAKLISLVVDVEFDYLLNNLQLIKNELDKEVISTKNQRCDYIANIRDSLINIEVNNNATIEVLERNIEYSHKLYASRIRVGSKYTYNQVIQININNFSFKDNENTIDYFYMKNQEGKALNEKIIYVNIYLPNNYRKWYNEGKESLTELERYILAIAEPDVRVSEEISEGDIFMEDTVKEIKEFCLEEDLRESYDKEWADISQGRLEGRREGHIEGKKEGLKEGKEEQIKIDAVNLHKNGVTDELITKSLNITQEQLEEYLKEAE